MTRPPPDDPVPLVGHACGYEIGPRDSFAYRVLDGKPGIWCRGCLPGRSADDEEEG